MLISKEDAEDMSVIPLHSAKNSLAEDGMTFSSMKLKQELPFIKENIKIQNNIRIIRTTD